MLMFSFRMVDLDKILYRMCVIHSLLHTYKATLLMVKVVLWAGLQFHIPSYSLLSKRPTLVTISLESICNLKCSHKDSSSVMEWILTIDLQLSVKEVVAVQLCDFSLKLYWNKFSIVFFIAFSLHFSLHLTNWTKTFRYISKYQSLCKKWIFFKLLIILDTKYFVMNFLIWKCEILKFLKMPKYEIFFFNFSFLTKLQCSGILIEKGE